METIKINFCDFWDHFNKEDNFIVNILRTKFTINISDNPDFLIFSCYGMEHLNYNCYRIFYSGENVRINWNGCDYAFSFDYLENNRHFRLPNWVWYDDPTKLIEPKNSVDQIMQSKTRFCNMVVSNPLAKKRIDFFNKLSRYKMVDSGGRYLNNIGGPVVNKLDFISNYKFTIAFENSSFPGYATEKIFEPMLVGSIPIYWGDPEIERDFNTRSFLNWHDFGSDEKLIEYIIELDNNDSLYAEMLKQSWFRDNKLPDCVSNVKIINMFKIIFTESYMNRPVAQQKNRIFKYKSSLFLKRVDDYLNRFLNYREKFR